MSFQDLPIRRKVRAVIMLTSVTALLLTAAVFICYDLLSYRRAMLDNLSTTAAVVASHSRSVLRHNDPGEAQDLLSAMSSDPYLAGAALYDAQGKLIAHYPADAPVKMFPGSPADDGKLVQDGQAIIFQPVMDGSKTLGTLYLKSSLTPLAARLKYYGGIALLVLCGSVLVALALSTLLERRISEPIQSLADTVRTVSERKDISVRAAAAGNDELGLLAEAFNRMLSQIQQGEQSRSFLAAMVESADAAIIGKDLSSKVVSWNAGAERLYGFTAAEMVGQPIHRIVPPERSAEEVQITDAAKGGEIRNYETLRIAKDGRQFFVSLTVSPIKDNRGEIIGVSSVSRDITDRIRAEEQIRVLNFELEKRVLERTAALTDSNREMEAFIYSVAHDLRAPLRHMDAFSKILLEEFSAGLPLEVVRYLESIRKGSRHMSQLIDDLLNLARVGRQELSRQVVSLNGIVNEAVSDLKAETEGREIEWHIAELPELACDPGLMRQVFANLLSNAVKYTRPRAHTVIEIGLAQKDGIEAVFVRDNGVGFNMRYANKLFGVFQRLHRQEDFEGTGVGLAIVERVIRRHGGSIWAEGKPGEGASFYFSLPGLSVGKLAAPAHA